MARMDRETAASLSAFIFIVSQAAENNQKNITISTEIATAVRDYIQENQAARRKGAEISNQKKQQNLKMDPESVSARERMRKSRAKKSRV